MLWQVWIKGNGGDSVYKDYASRVIIGHAI